MPYITNAQKERFGWSNLEFAIHLIRAADRCDEGAALHQLRLAIADGMYESPGVIDPGNMLTSLFLTRAYLPRMHGGGSTMLNLTLRGGIRQPRMGLIELDY